MKKITLIGLVVTGFVLNGFGSEKLADKIEFATIEKAKILLTQEDDFTKSWSQFDIDSRMHKKNSSKEELLDFITKQTREWTIEEKNIIVGIFESIDEQIEKQGFKINFPDEIYLVKTTANEEGGAKGYTRARYIILKEDFLSPPYGGIKETIVHELFHILSRNNPEFREEMYQIIGFHLMNDVSYPENLKAFRITNPDAPQVDSYIRLKADGQSKDCTMILYSDKEYSGGDIFNYLNVGFLSLTGDSVKTIEYQDGKAVIYSFQQVTGFFEQVGKNTQYIIQPEEILADNFTFAILNKLGLPDQDIVNEIKKKLQE